MLWTWTYVDVLRNSPDSQFAPTILLRTCAMLTVLYTKRESSLIAEAAVSKRSVMEESSEGLAGQPQRTRPKGEMSRTVKKSEVHVRPLL